MPRYHWKGRTAQGAKLEGDLDASSAEGAREQLRRQQITISAIVETGAGGPIDTRPRERRAPRFTRFKSLGVAAMFAAAAAVVGLMAPITVWTCERAAGTVACSISERDLGVIELRSHRLPAVESVEIETEMVAPSRTGVSSPRPQKRVVFLDGKGGSIRSFGWDQERPSEWFRRPRVASTERIAEEFRRFLADDSATRHSAWGAYFVPLILVGALLLLSLLMLSITALSLFIRPEWVMAQAEVLAKRNRTRTTP